MNNFQKGLAILCLAVGACATTPAVSPEVKAQLAPGGKLRVGILHTNALHATQGLPPGELRGIAPDIGREIARRLGAEFQPVTYTTIDTLLDGAPKGEWDIAFAGYAAERRAQMDFTPVMINGGNAYLVRGESPLRSVSEVDRPGARVGVAGRTVQDAYLKANLKSARLTNSATTAELVKALAAGEVDAVAGNHMAMAAAARTLPGSRLLEGSFMQVPYAIAIKKGTPGGAAYTSRVIEDMKSNGMLEDIVRRANVEGVTVAR
jgi:polar amino acid transport system substrate-binding protein